MKIKSILFGRPESTYCNLFCIFVSNNDYFNWYHDFQGNEHRSLGWGIPTGEFFLINESRIKKSDIWK